jgi:hypothetical protein
MINISVSSEALHEEISKLYSQLAFVSSTVLLNVVLTCLIARKLMTHRQNSLGLGSKSCTQYTNVITLIVESAFAWIVAGTIYLGLLVASLSSDSSAIYLWEYVFQLTVVSIFRPAANFHLPLRQQLSPAVLIFRVALNKHYLSIADQKLVQEATIVDARRTLSSLEAQKLPEHELDALSFSSDRTRVKVHSEEAVMNISHSTS